MVVYGGCIIILGQDLDLRRTSMRMEKNPKHVRPNGGFLDGDECHGIIRKQKSPNKQIQEKTAGQKEAG